MVFNQLIKTGNNPDPTGGRGGGGGGVHPEK